MSLIAAATSSGVSTFVTPINDSSWLVGLSGGRVIFEGGEDGIIEVAAGREGLLDCEREMYEPTPGIRSA
jgi:hypothetical protein